MANDKGKAARLPQVERMKSEGYTNEQIADKLKVTSRTIANDVAELRSKGFIKESRKELPQSQEGRDMLVEENVKTLDTVRWLITEGRTLLHNIQEFMGLSNHAPCEACGCKGRYLNAQDFMAASKIMDSLTNSLTLLAKVLGEITDSPVVNVLQMDSDVTLLLRSIMRGDQTVVEQLNGIDKALELLAREEPSVQPHVAEIRSKILAMGEQPLGRYVYQELTGQSQRRANRLPNYQALLEEATIEGEFTEVD